MEAIVVREGERVIIAGDGATPCTLWCSDAVRTSPGKLARLLPCLVPLELAAASHTVRRLQQAAL